MWTRIKLSAAFFICIVLAASLTSLVIAGDQEIASKRQTVDKMAEDALADLFREIDSAFSLYEEAYGYAVFDKFKLPLIDSPGGLGVLVEKDSGTRLYMDLGTAGIHLGHGVRQYQAVFFFATEEDLNAFRDDGSRTASSSQGSALDSEDEEEITFTDGVAFYYQLSDEGTVSRTGSGGGQHVGAYLNWKPRSVPTCRPRPDRRLNDDCPLAIEGPGRSQRGAAVMSMPIMAEDDGDEPYFGGPPSPFPPAWDFPAASASLS